jgi:hypothetical protein
MKSLSGKSVTRPGGRPSPRAKGPIVVEAPAVADEDAVMDSDATVAEGVPGADCEEIEEPGGTVPPF